MRSKYSSGLLLLLPLVLFSFLPGKLSAQPAQDSSVLSSEWLASVESEIVKMVRKYPETGALFLRLADGLTMLEKDYEIKLESLKSELESLRKQSSVLSQEVKDLSQQLASSEALRMQLDAEWQKELGRLQEERDRAKLERNLSLGAFGLTAVWAIIK